MTYRSAKSLDQLLAELNAVAPKRSKLSDGWIGDAAHASRDSDHNPWVKDGTTGVVTARDFTHDPAHGADMEAFVAQLVKRRDPRIKYIIWNRRMWRAYAKPKCPAWTPTAYTGANAHTKHAHISVSSEKAQYDSAASWGLSKLASTSTTGATTPAKPTNKPTPVADKAPAFEPYKDGIALGSRNIKEGSSGNDVKWVQAALGVRADGYFGQITELAVMEWQQSRHLTPDGIVGPITWKALKAFKTPVVPSKPVTPANPPPPLPTQEGATEFVKNGRHFPSRDGYPVYAQGYNAETGKTETWGNIVIASSTGRNVSQIGCAMTAVTMALSGITGRTITPDEMAAFMKNNGGFGSGGDITSWDLMGNLVSPPVDLYRITDAKADKIDSELNAGRPVIVHVDYYTKTGNTREGKHDKKGDHWFLVTGRTADNRYQANDPAAGKQITLHKMSDGRLEGDFVTKYGTKYITVGNAVTFSRGPAARTGGHKPSSQTPVTPPVVPPKVVSTTPKSTGSTKGSSKGTEKVVLPTFAGADRAGTVKAIRDECLRQGVTMAAQIAYVLATVEHETGNTFQPIREAAYLGAKAEDYRKKNLRYYPYYGRGYVQLTWDYNYEKYAKLLGLEMVKSPDIALRPDVALFILVHGMRTGTYSGQKMSTFINASRVDFRGARAVVNGSSRADIIAGLARKWLTSMELKNVA